MIYRLDTFLEQEINPITGESYDESWIVLILNNSTEYRQLCGSFNGCAYTVKLSCTMSENWMMDAGDFIDFNERHGKNTILVMSEQALCAVRRAYKGHAYNDRFLRTYEPKVLVHSTPLASWKSIKSDGMLKSWNRLKKEGAVKERYPIGKLLGDPLDFSQYVMFGSGVTGEIVVHAKQVGRIDMDVDSTYQPGARLYFDAEKLARDGRLIRDGSHLKVKDMLPLDPYLIWVATAENIGLPDAVTTPRLFADMADHLFKERYKVL